MPNSLSAKKRLRQNEKNAARNRAIKSAVRNQVKKVRKLIEAGEIESSETEFRLAAKRLDRAADRNAIHANQAARTKSRLSKAIKQAKNK